MRTAIVTCFFVALGSVGETVHKLTLRISGALIGGALAALCIVFVFPTAPILDNCVCSLRLFRRARPGSPQAANSSPMPDCRLPFVFLGVLQNYAPATDLTELRDRVAGILLGNVVVTIVFSVFWPQSAAARVRSAIGQALRALAALSSRRRRLPLIARRRHAPWCSQSTLARSGASSCNSCRATFRPSGSPFRSGDLAVLEGRVFVSSEVSPGYREEDRRVLGGWANEAAAAVDPSPPGHHPRSSHQGLRNRCAM